MRFLVLQLARLNQLPQFYLLLRLILLSQFYQLDQCHQYHRYHQLDQLSRFFLSLLYSQQHHFVQLVQLYLWDLCDL
jgi:hypothetical protein